jgi:FlaA1/EpsC-like NDP-sugar epimerase
MGEPVRIMDLARDMIRLSGLSTDDIDIVFTGVRPGEKLFEELYFADETTLTTAHPKVRGVSARVRPLDEVRRLFAELFELADEVDPKLIHKRLRETVPAFKPDEATASTWHSTPPATLSGPKSGSIVSSS